MWKTASFFKIFFFLKRKNPTGHWAKQLGMHRMPSSSMQGLLLLPWHNDTQYYCWKSDCFGFFQLHTMHPYIRASDWHPVISSLTWEEKKKKKEDRHFPPDHIPGEPAADSPNKRLEERGKKRTTFQAQWLPSTLLTATLTFVLNM